MFRAKQRGRLRNREWRHGVSWHGLCQQVQGCATSPRVPSAWCFTWWVPAAGLTCVTQPKLSTCFGGNSFRINTFCPCYKQGYFFSPLSFEILMNTTCRRPAEDLRLTSVLELFFSCAECNQSTGHRKGKKKKRENCKLVQSFKSKPLFISS